MLSVHVFVSFIVLARPTSTDKDYITPYWWYAMHYYVVVVLVAEHVPFYALRSVSLRIG